MASLSDVRPCCGGDHPFDSRRVRELWWPPTIRCLVVGESPGGPEDPYFYDVPERPDRDPIRVRGRLLRGLTEVGLIIAPTLEAFTSAGFLFDHGIRCQLPDARVREEWRRAKRYESQYARSAVHLRPVLTEAAHVWVMGYIARNALVCQGAPQLLQYRGITPAYFLRDDRRFFVSRYLSRASRAEAADIFAHVRGWLGS